MSRSTLQFIACAIIVVGVVGCDGGKDGLVAVRGVVFYQNTPLETGSIVFAPDESRGNRGPLAHAEIQADGSFTLYTGDSPGAVPGWHRVTVVAVDKNRAGASLLPMKYSDPELSNLSCEVQPGKSNGIHFRLE